MNILKKASLLIPFILLSMLLLSSHTTDSFIGPEDDFDIILVADGHREGHKTCDAVMKIAGVPSQNVQITLTISTMIQLWFFPIDEQTFTAQQLFGDSNEVVHVVDDLFKDYAGQECPTLFQMTVHTPNGSFTVSDYKVVYPICN